MEPLDIPLDRRCFVRFLRFGLVRLNVKFITILVIVLATTACSSWVEETFYGKGSNIEVKQGGILTAVPQKKSRSVLNSPPRPQRALQNQKKKSLKSRFDTKPSSKTSPDFTVSRAKKEGVGMAAIKNNLSPAITTPNTSELKQIKEDIYNRHIEDIHYVMGGRNNNLAIGEKWIVQNKGISRPICTIPMKDNTEVKSIFAKRSCKGESQFISNNKHPHKKVFLISKSITFAEANFEDLHGWNNDNFNDAIESFFNSCKAFAHYKRSSKSVENGELKFGPIEAWMEVCIQALEFAKQDRAKEFFEHNFIPFLVKDRHIGSSIGKITGYCELSVNGSRHKTAKYKYPIYQKPEWCKSSASCPTREQIYNGKIPSQYVISYTTSPMEIVKLQMQGSGIILFENSSFARVSFGGTNNYKQIDPLSKISVYSSLPKSRDALYKFLKENPNKAGKVMVKNPSYTFFRPNNNTFAVGSHSALIPSRSIAIDPKFIPYGAPIWLETKIPVRKKEDYKSWIPFNRLVVAQDTGSAIKGVVRADLFLGHGTKASYIAHRMNFPGRYYILLPRKVVDKISKKKPLPIMQSSKKQGTVKRNFWHKK